MLVVSIANEKLEVKFSTESGLSESQLKKEHSSHRLTR